MTIRAKSVEGIFLRTKKKMTGKKLSKKKEENSWGGGVLPSNLVSKAI